MLKQNLSGLFFEYMPCIVRTHRCITGTMKKKLIEQKPHQQQFRLTFEYSILHQTSSVAPLAVLQSTLLHVPLAFQYFCCYLLIHSRIFTSFQVSSNDNFSTFTVNHSPGSKNLLK